MSIKSHSGSESSPEDKKLYVSPSFVRDRDEKGWRPYVANNSELLTTASAIFSQISNPSSEEEMTNQASFLYDYYGMTDETRQEPPSPGHSPTGLGECDHERDEGNRDPNIEESNAVDIPISIKESDSPVIEMRHSFPESGKTQEVYVTQSNESSLSLSKRLHSATSMPSINRDKISSSSHISSTAEVENAAKMSFSHFSRQMFNNEEKYTYILEAQTSLVQKRGEDSLTYLNKGQFYYISSEAQASKLNRVKSVIHLVFRHEKDPNTELIHWKYWYNQQPNPNQRALDIDMKACQNIEDVEEVGYNALAFYWDPNIRVKVSLRINCLSTDFSAQKGVKGIPLHLQIDTFEDFSEMGDPVHRAFCQIKVFRDKGAERKNKDETKTVSKRMVKYLKGSDTSQADVSHVFQIANKVTFLYPTTNIQTKSVIFVPPKEKERTKSTDSTSSTTSASGGGFLSQIKERENKRGFNAALSNAKDDLEHLDVLPKPKAPRVVPKREPVIGLTRHLSQPLPRLQQRHVTIYVRKEEEKAYNALMLEALTLDELKKSISQKYGVPEEMMKQVFKKTKKGILVYLDDQLIEQFVDEDDFLISINFDNQLGHFEVIFNC